MLNKKEKWLKPIAGNKSVHGTKTKENWAHNIAHRIVQTHMLMVLNWVFIFELLLGPPTS